MESDPFVAERLRCLELLGVPELLEAAMQAPSPRVDVTLS
jgi:hypothetical protein